MPSAEALPAGGGGGSSKFWSRKIVIGAFCIALNGCDSPPPLAHPGTAVSPSAIMTEANDKNLIILGAFPRADGRRFS
jgi:hypothetical protein